MKKLNEFDNFNLKYRKKLTIINTELNIAKDYINNLHLEPNSYKINVSIKKNGDSLNSIYKLKIDEQINLQK